MAMNRYQKSAEASGMLFGSLKPTARLDSLKLYEPLEIDEFLGSLNRKEPVRPPLLPQKPTDIPRVNVSALPSAGEILRGWIDEWLNSGRDKSGAENPQWRTFKRAEEAGRAAYEYSKRGNLRLLPYGNRLAPILEQQNEPDRYEFGMKFKLEESARGKLVLFLLSDLRLKLAKCRNESCGKYFVLKHWKRAYKGGTRCESCGRSRSLDSAKAVTARERKSVKESLYLSAAKHFAKRIAANPLWYSDAALKSSIAKSLSAKIERSESMRAVYPRGIQGKWVANAKNWKPIQEAVKGGL